MYKVFLLLSAFLALSASRAPVREIVNPFVCKPGLAYKMDCNLCNCGNGTGPGMCTLMACNLGKDECIPGSYFQIRGQLCPCPKNGYKWDSDCFGKTCRG